MSKKMGVTNNWKDHFVHLATDGMLTFYTTCSEHPVAGSTAGKVQLAGGEESGETDVRHCTSVRASTAPTATAGEIECETPDATYRFRPASSVRARRGG